MDLKELNNFQARRHPWETARLKALQRIIGPYTFEGIRILDVGCGDGFIANGLVSHLDVKKITGVDTLLTDKLIQKLESFPSDMQYLKKLPEEGIFDLILLLDVLEHVKDDRAFLADLIVRHVSKGGKLLITVPAFQSLYSNHDVYLGHYRRYLLREIEEVATVNNLKIVLSGYLFLSLLLPKLVFFKFLNSGKCFEGVGLWRWGKTMTTLCEGILNIDNYLLLAVSRMGLKLPGLTGWVLCEKQE